MTGYGRLTFRLAPADEERLAAELWQLGTLGLEIEARPPDAIEARAYFAAPDAAAMRRAPAEWRRLGAELVEQGAVAERDWLADYRRRARPFRVGRRLAIDPREPGAAEPGLARDRILLRLPARSAFGTGSHESTRLLLEFLEELPLAGLAVLDVGSGSGVLAFAALALGAASAVGVEIDPAAALVAGQNRRLNGPRPRFVAGRVTALAPQPVYDVLLANVLPEAIRPELPELARRLRVGGRALFSGILAERAAAAEAALVAAGLRPRGRRRAGEWVALVTERAAG